MNIRVFLLIFVSTLGPGLTDIRGERVTDEARGFSFELPADFTAYAAGKTRAEILLCFAKSGVSPQSAPIVLQVEELKGTFSASERLTESDFPKISGTTFSLGEISWKKNKLDRVRQTVVAPDGNKFAAYCCQFPTSPRALQLQVAGPQEREEEIASVFSSVVSSFDDALTPISTPATIAAVKGLEAMNRNDGATFVRWAHPKLIEKMRDLMVAQLETAARQGEQVDELTHFGVRTVEELKSLDPKVVTRVTVDHMNDSEPAKLRELMHHTKFSTVSSKAIDPATVVVTINGDFGDGRSKTVEVLSKLDGGVWKYWGFPELLRE